MQGPVFGPFIVANLLQRLFQVEADLTSNSCEWNLELAGPFFCAFCYVLRKKRSPPLSHGFAPMSMALRPLRPTKACLRACSKMFCSNFHGLAPRFTFQRLLTRCDKTASCWLLDRIHESVRKEWCPCGLHSVISRLLAGGKPWFPHCASVASWRN